MPGSSCSSLEGLFLHGEDQKVSPHGSFPCRGHFQPSPQPPVKAGSFAALPLCRASKFFSTKGEKRRTELLCQPALSPLSESCPCPEWLKQLLQSHNEKKERRGEGLNKFTQLPPGRSKAWAWRATSPMVKCLINQPQRNITSPSYVFCLPLRIFTSSWTIT